ncbi:uncharacterized protein LOC127258757 isoform X2 [Andrographis paniculata]|uniref:uncharacterized protein LOC127258757 isoform X2 n=1 Tax=Andrographis paniculata TaxID=175694 RepID=UPI0021E99BC3|nr:uncharacterized protein LOC127258757 isoform X2 [Andrographis paniculata]
MENGMSSSKEKQVIVDIESDDQGYEAQGNRETTSRGNKRGKRSLEKHASGVLNYNGSSGCDGEASTTAAANSEDLPGESFENASEPSLELLHDRDFEEQQRLIEKGQEKERRKAGKVKKAAAAKPPRPPNGPTLYAADLWLIDELSRMAMIKKRERSERAKALKTMQSGRGSSTSSTSLSSAQGATIFAMVITVVFLLVIIFQGITTRPGSGLSPGAAPQPAPQTLAGMPSPLQFYNSVSSDDDGAAAPAPAPAPAPSKSTGIARKF